MPESDDNQQDPWRHQGDGRRRKGGDGPPDLEELVENFLRKLSSGRRKRAAGNSGRQDSGGGFKPKLIHILAVALLIWGAFGFFIVDEREQAVVLQFGKYRETLNPGLHWVPTGIQTQETVDMKTVRSLTSRATLLTGDENIISLEYDIQFVINDIKNFLFNVRDPARDPYKTVRDVVESSVREVVGFNQMDYLLTEGRSFVGDRSSDLGQAILDSYGIGISLQTVNLISAQPPDPVQSAFSDTNKAREDEQRYINEAEVYRNEVMPKARGRARELVEEARAYSFLVVESAKGETERFRKVYAEYSKAPDITRERLYIETMEEIMQRSNKVFIDAKESRPFLYIPSPDGERRQLDSLSGSGTSRPAVPPPEEILQR